MTEYRAPNPVTLKTQRLFLRKVGIKDVNEIFLLRSAPENNAYLDRPLCESLDQALAFIYKINTGNPYYWGVASAVTNKLLGTACLYDLEVNPAKCQIGFEILPEFAGQGLMREAVSELITYATRELKLVTIEAHTHTGNQPSRNLLERLGFIATGTAGAVDTALLTYILETKNFATQIL